MKPDSDIQLEQRVARMIAGTAQFEAPHDTATRVLRAIEGRVHMPWWRRRVMEWPQLAQLVFVLAGVATAAALLLGRPAMPKGLDAFLPQPGAVLRVPAADLHATLNVLSVFHRLTDTVAGALPDDVWYGGLALCAAAYVALLLLIIFGYRLLQAPAASRSN